MRALMIFTGMIASLFLADHFAFGGTMSDWIVRDTLHGIRAAQAKTHNWVEQFAP